MSKIFIFTLFYFSFLMSSPINNYNSIFYFAKSPITNSLGGIHFPASNVGEVFYQPILKESKIKNNFSISFSNPFNSQLEIVQLSYCINHSSKNNLSIGFVNRLVKDVYNTINAWDIDQFLIPDFSDINYNEIDNLSYKDFAFLFSYSKYLKNINLNVKFKPSYNSYETNKALGLDLDVLSHFFIPTINTSFTIGIDNFFSYKKWDSGDIQKNIKEYFISGVMSFEKINIYLQTDSLYDDKIAFEYKAGDLFCGRIGMSDNESYAIGFGLYSKTIELDYAYLKHDFLGNTNQISILFNVDNLKLLKDNIDI